MVDVCGGRRSAPDAWYSVRLPWVLCSRCEPETVVRDGEVSCLGCKVNRFLPACLFFVFVLLACPFVLSPNRFVRFAPRSSTLLRFYARRTMPQSLPLTRSSVFRYSPPTTPVITARTLHAHLFWLSFPLPFQFSASSSFHLIFLLLCRHHIFSSSPGGSKVRL